MNATRHAHFVLVNTLAAALASAVVFSLLLGVFDPSIPPAYGRDIALAYVARMTSIAACANVLLHPVVARCQTWTARSMAFGVSFAVCIVVFAGWTALFDTRDVDPVHVPIVRVWLMGVLVFYGALFGAPVLALDLLLDRALRRHLFA